MDPIHELHRELLELGIVGPEPLQPFHPRVRDRDDISALRCPSSGVILLDRIDHIGEAFYAEGDHNGLEQVGSREALGASQAEDTTRRAALLRPVVSNRDWVDIGTGGGAILDAIGHAARSVTAVEPQRRVGELLRADGYDVHAGIDELPAASFDVVTEFHVFEHVPAPSTHLSEVRRVLRPGGLAIFEVPHARDLLLTMLRSEPFRRFTLWSEHLVLHTRQSLRRLLEAASFVDVVVSGAQRYPLANHLHWLVEGLPGGHDRWSMLRDHALDEAYESTLARLDGTDTLLAFARVPASSTRSVTE